MSNRTIWVNFGDYGNVYKIELSPDQKLIQTHRKNKWIDFTSCQYAISTLSPEAFMLYMDLVMHSVDWPWALIEEQVTKNTQLTATDLEWAVQELIDKNYLTPGEINAFGKTYKRNCYHLWEEPSMRLKHKTN